MTDANLKHDVGVDLHGDDLHAIWTALDGRRSGMLKRHQQYAAWTIPSLVPEEGQTEDDEQERGNVEIGATVVNHLANRIVQTMFPSEKPFFMLKLTEDARQRLQEEAEDDKSRDELPQVAREAALAAENAAMRQLNLTAYIPVAIQAIKHQIVTGNALMRRFPDNTRVVYGIRDYVVVRGLDGEVLFVMTRDQKRMENLTPELKTLVAAGNSGGGKEDAAVVTLFTRWRKVNGKWTQDQGIDAQMVPNSTKRFKGSDVPFLLLTWERLKGENYGRGLVEDNSVIFSNIETLSDASLDMIGIAADIKWFVDPGSVTDVEELNNAERGKYVAGKEGDVTTPRFERINELTLVEQKIEALNRRLSQAFLHNTTAVRDAERVTAEEIRMFARELESAFGGVYSKLALEWQKAEATYLLSQVNLTKVGAGTLDYMDLLVTTGLETLSREGQLENIRLAIADLQMLDTVPEEIRGRIHPMRFAQRIFELRGLNLSDVFLTEDELKQAQQQQLEQQKALMDMQAQSDAAGAAASAAAQAEGQ